MSQLFRTGKLYTIGDSAGKERAMASASRDLAESILRSAELSEKYDGDHSCISGWREQGYLDPGLVEIHLNGPIIFKDVPYGPRYQMITMEASVKGIEVIRDRNY